MICWQCKFGSSSAFERAECRVVLVVSSRAKEPVCLVSHGRRRGQSKEAAQVDVAVGRCAHGRLDPLLHHFVALGESVRVGVAIERQPLLCVGCARSQREHSPSSRSAHARRRRRTFGELRQVEQARVVLKLVVQVLLRVLHKNKQRREGQFEEPTFNTHMAR